MTVKNGLSDGEILTVRQTRIYDKGERNVFIKIFGDWNGLSVQHAHTGSASLLILKLSGRKLKSPHTVLLLLYLCVLAGIYSVTGLPDIRYCSFDFSFNVIPMLDLLSSPSQYLLNVLMFVPVGFLLPLLWDGYQDWKQVLGFCCFLTIFIEIAQVFTFRTTDIDDLITNLLGAGIGYLLIDRKSVV